MKTMCKRVKIPKFTTWIRLEDVECEIQEDALMKISIFPSMAWGQN
jgi:hypothetical protein